MKRVGMKTQRGITVIIATLVLLILSLSITFTTAASSNLPPTQRKIVLTAKVVDNGGNEVTGAHVAVFQGEQHLGQGYTDNRGIVQIEIVVNTDKAVVLALEVSKAGMETTQHKLKLGTDFPTRLPIEGIELRPGASRSLLVLPVTVLDSEGHGVQGALVNVYKGALDSSMFASPPVAYDTTNANGTVTFKLPLRAGEIPDIRLAVSKEDMVDQRRPLNLQANFPIELPTEIFKLMPRAAVEGDYPSANIRVNVKDDQGNNLEGALLAVSAESLTPSQRNRPHEKSTGPDGSATVAIELMSAAPNEHIGITVSKRGYKEFKDVMEVNNKWHSAEGKTFDFPKTVTLVKLPEGFEVKVTVLDGNTNNGVPDAEVILDGPDYATSMTNSQGVATLAVDKPGSYAVRISQDNYRSLSNGQVRVRPEDKLKVVDPPFRLLAKRTKDEAGDTIEITVLAKDSIEADSKTRPLREAAVSDGRGTTYTDENGHALLRGAYEGSQQITVRAKDYKPSTQKVGINRFFPLSKGTGSATFTLDPELSDHSPVRLAVEVRDAAEPHNKLNRAFVYLWLKDTNIASQSAPDGETIFILTDRSEMPLTKLRSGLRIFAKAANYKLRESDVTDLLQPSLETKRATIFLERDWDELRKAVETLEAKVSAWKYGMSANPNQIQKYIDTASSYRQDAQALFNEIDAAAKTLPELTSFGSDPSLCAAAARLQLGIRSSESKINSKASELEKTLKDASARAPRCSSPAEAESLRASYRQAIQLLGEIGKLKNQVIKDQEALSLLVPKAGAAQRVLAQMKDKTVRLQTLTLVAQSNQSNATAYLNRMDNLSGSSTSVQLSLKAELAVLTVKVEAETGVPPDLLQKINALQQLLATASTVTATPLPLIVRSAPLEIAQLEANATAKVAEFDRSICQVTTLDDAVETIKKTFDNASYEVAFANDLPSQADVCIGKTAKRSDAAKPPTNTADKPDEQSSTVNTPGTGNKQPTNELPEDKIAKPNKPADQTNSSGGFWEAAKAGKKDVENKVTKKPEQATNPTTTTEANAGDNRRTNTARNRTDSKANKPSPTVEEIPEDSGSTNTTTKKTDNKTNKPPVSVEEIPEDNSTKIAANKPARKTANKPPVVEEIPEETAVPNGASNRARANSPQVEEIPETSTNNPPATGGSGGNATNSSRSSGNDQAKPKKEKKPRDPNKPDIWTRLGGAARAAITGQQNPGVVNNPGDNTNPGNNGGGQSLNLAGTWSVTTKSTGDDDMQQNWTRTTIWQVWNLGGGRWRVRQVINDQTYDENYSTVDDGSGRFRLIGSNPDGSTYEMSGTYNQSEFQVSTSGSQNRITISGTRQ
jgi:protocatechuate 3,4-dioxygenase beta subunit